MAQGVQHPAGQMRSAMHSSGPGPHLTAPDVGPSPLASTRESLSASTSYDPTGPAGGGAGTQGLLSDSSMAAMRSWSAVLEPAPISASFTLQQATSTPWPPSHLPCC